MRDELVQLHYMEQREKRPLFTVQCSMIVKGKSSTPSMDIFVQWNVYAEIAAPYS